MTLFAKIPSFVTRRSPVVSRSSRPTVKRRWSSGKKSSNRLFTDSCACTEDSGWLVQDIINFFFLFFDCLTVDGDLIAFPVDVVLGQPDRFAIDLNSAFEDQFF